MKVFITGGAGFIGSHLADSYIEQGDEVFVIDNLSTGSYANIKHLENNKRFHFHEDTIFNYEKMLELTGICDIVFHMAAAVGVNYVLKNPLLSIQTNIKGTDLVLELCDKFQKRLMIASTSEVYGKHTHAPLRETDDIVYGPSMTWRWSYAASKLVDEYNSIAYHRTKRLDVTIVRLFNTVGPRQSKEYGMVLPRFIDQALKGSPITVYGDGEQTRTFTYVTDVITALKKLDCSNKAAGEIVNIGGSEEVSILNLANRVKTHTGSDSSIKVIPYDQAYDENYEDMLRRVPSVEKLMRLIEYVPDTNLDQILGLTIVDAKRRQQNLCR